jgi:hypothetical protein
VYSLPRAFESAATSAEKGCDEPQIRMVRSEGLVGLVEVTGTRREEEEEEEEEEEAV